MPMRVVCLILGLRSSIGENESAYHLYGTYTIDYFLPLFLKLTFIGPWPNWNSTRAIIVCWSLKVSSHLKVWLRSTVKIVFGFTIVEAVTASIPFWFLVWNSFKPSVSSEFIHCLWKFNSIYLLWCLNKFFPPNYPFRFSTNL